MFHPEALFEMVKPVGVDSVTAEFTRLEKAGVLVEVDITKNCQEAVLIGATRAED